MSDLEIPKIVFNRILLGIAWALGGLWLGSWLMHVLDGWSIFAGLITMLTFLATGVAWIIHTIVVWQDQK